MTIQMPAPPAPTNDAPTRTDTTDDVARFESLLHKVLNDQNIMKSLLHKVLDDQNIMKKSHQTDRNIMTKKIDSLCSKIDLLIRIN